MLEQNYTNQEDKGRFGFSESGTFRSSFKSEPTLIIIFTVILIGGTIGGIAGAAAFLNTMMMSMDESTRDNGAFFCALTAGVIIVAAAVVSFIIFKIGTNYVKRGFECTFSASEEVFTAKIGGDVHTIRYNEVQSVLFEPKTLFGKICGYNISVIIGNRSETFGVAFEGQFQSEKTTPFYIIKERKELIEARRIEEAAKLSEIKNQSHKALGREDVEKARKKKKTTEDRLEALFAQGSEMSAVAPKKTGDGQPQNPDTPADTADTADEEMPEISAKK